MTIYLVSTLATAEKIVLGAITQGMRCSDERLHPQVPVTVGFETQS